MLITTHNATNLIELFNSDINLTQYINSHSMSNTQKEAIIRAIRENKNILIIGGTGSGKTTLLNAIINEITNDILIHELNDKNMNICIGENIVYENEAFSFLNDWNINSRFGVATFHAQDSMMALLLLKSNISEDINTFGYVQDKIDLFISKTVNLIICISRDNEGFHIKEVTEILGYENEQIITKKL